MKNNPQSSDLQISFAKSFLRLFALVGFLGIFFAGPPLARAQYYPDHPVVKEMVDRGVLFLSKNPPAAGGDSGFGAQILSAYTIYKVEGDPDLPPVAKGIQAAKDYLDKTTRAQGGFDHKSIYNVSVCCMLLASVSIDTYGPQLIAARDFFLRVQQRTGAYGYIDGSHKLDSGDISQTQYVLLALWTMYQAGIEIPEDKVMRTLDYLYAAQIRDPMGGNTGGWPYQFEPGNMGALNTSNSLAACGLSSVLIAGDILGVFRNRLAEADEEDGLIPPAFKRVLAESEKKKRGGNVDRAKLDNCVKGGLDYNRRHPYQRTTWHYYYLYSLERFESFLEIANGKQNKSPPWYNAEIEKMRAVQGADGSFGGQGSKDLDTVLEPQTATCLAILFLIRSTQKAIGDLKEAIAIGGNELPSDLTTVTMLNGKPVSKNEATSIDDALKMLEDDKKAQGEDKLVADKIIFSKDPARKKDELNRFARLLRSKDWQARRIAAKVLGRSDDLDLVPELIFALSDRDSVVNRNAETSLRLISRKLDKYHLPKEGGITEQDRIKAQREWKTWFLELRPDYIFVE
jgi:hypothetical protein